MIRCKAHQLAAFPLQDPGGHAQVINVCLYFMDDGLILRSMDPISMLAQGAAENPVGATLGVLQEAYNKETIQKFEQGDVVGGGMDVVKGLALGTLAEKGLNMAGPAVSRLAGAVVLPKVAYDLLNQSADPESTTNYVLDKHGPSVLMNKNRPDWAVPDSMQPYLPTEEDKPAHVEAAEKGMQWIGGMTMKAVNGGMKLVRESPAAQGAIGGIGGLFTK